MRILLLASAFNGLTQRVWCDLRDRGHEVGVELAPAYDEAGLTRAVEAADPDLIVCPFLKHRVPEAVWGRWDTVIVHPGPVGDRGPSSLDHAILEGHDRWGVTALSAVEEMDAGPVWTTSEFDLPSPPIAKSALYNSLVADAALVCVAEVLRMVEAGERPVPAEEFPATVRGTGELPLLRRTAFRLDLTEEAHVVARRVAAADGAPGAPATIGGRDFCLFDAVATTEETYTTEETGAEPGTVVGHDSEAVAVACGRGTLWVGYAAELVERKRGPKLPATRVLPSGEQRVFTRPVDHAETSYRREGDVGYLTIRSHNGAMHTEQCRRITSAVEKALVEDTRVLVVSGTEHAFSNGIHLGVIDAATDPAAEAWDNIRAIDELCLALASADQLTVAAVSANAGAGGVMMALCVDVTVARDGVVLNPYYDMGIYGSELHTWALPARVGEAKASALLADKLPISVAEAERIGMLDGVGPRDPQAFDAWLRSIVAERLEPAAYDAALARRTDRVHPLSYHQTLELAEMGRDLFQDRHGFAAKRRDFVGKAAVTETPAKLRFPD